MKKLSVLFTILLILLFSLPASSKVLSKNVTIIQDAGLTISSGAVAESSDVHKFGRNPDIDVASGFEVIWNGGDEYTGQNATAAETLEVFSSSANDAGTVLSSGTATEGTATTLIDTGATFVTDGGAVGDVIIDDTQVDHGIVTAITETVITVLKTHSDAEFSAGDSYRLVTQASTGSPVVKLYQLLDGDFVAQPNEYIVLNGTTAVDTVGTYRRQTRANSHGGTNIGAITSRQKTTTANVMMVLPIGFNTTMIAAYTVPAGKKAFIDSWYVGLSGKINANCVIRLMVRPVNDVYQIAEELALQGNGSSFVHRIYRYHKGPIAAMSDIKIMSDTDTNNTSVAAGFDIILKDQ